MRTLKGIAFILLVAVYAAALLGILGGVDWVLWNGPQWAKIAILVATVAGLVWILGWVTGHFLYGDEE